MLIYCNFKLSFPLIYTLKLLLLNSHKVMKCFTGQTNKNDFYFEFIQHKYLHF
jgi:hypothetical protein